MTRLPERIVEVRAGPAGAAGLSWKTPFYSTFDVEQTDTSQPNKAKIDLYGLSEFSLAFLEQRSLVVQLFAGDDIPSLLFQGDLTGRGIKTAWKTPENVTTLECADGQSVYRDRHFCRSYPPGTALTLVLTDVIGVLRLPIGFQSPLPAFTFPGPMAWSASARSVLTQVLEFVDAHWSIVNGRVQILGAGVEVVPGNAILISAVTGMHGTPTRTNKGVDVVVNLNPAIRPGTLIQIQSRDITGPFKVKKTNHSGDEKGLKWETKINAAPL